jgi:hypothetical protein
MVRWTLKTRASDKVGMEEMVSFSSDVDILKYEPVLFGELHLPWQVIAKGNEGILNGTTFTASEADFISSLVTSGGVIYLQTADGILDGAYEIVSVDLATQLTISVIRAGDDDAAIAPPAATNISYRISTFRPQSNEVGFRLTEYFGIRPGNPASDINAGNILDSNVLKQASVFAVMSSVYAMLASAAEDENFWKKSLYYQKLFEKARGQCRLSIDADSDGVADVTLVGSSMKLVRS